MEVFGDKHERLNQLLLDYGQVGVAFSGGVDSSLLLRCALGTLGAGNVVVLHARSCLQAKAEQERAAGWLTAHGFGEGVEFLVLDLHPLRWKGFAANGEERCYLCKSSLYRTFLEELKQRGIGLLLDGTNMDDLKDRRPGLRAILELGVEMPLVRAGLDKRDVRLLSRELGLVTWRQPSASCLATRIPHGVTITEERLERIGRWEEVLAKMGFSGCRVCPDRTWQTVVIRLEADQFDRMVAGSVRQSVLRFFRKEGIGTVHLDLHGRQPSGLPEDVVERFVEAV